MSNRFTTEKQITDLIDFYKKEWEELRLDAAADDVLADHLRDTKWAWKIEGIRAEAESKRKRCQWRDARIKTLGEKLSEIQTPELPECKTDGSIPKS
jgi:hypothetical protein